MHSFWELDRSIGQTLPVALEGAEGLTSVVNRLFVVERDLHRDPRSGAEGEGARDGFEGMQAISEMYLVVQQRKALPHPEWLTGMRRDLNLENAVVLIGDTPEHMIRE